MAEQFFEQPDTLGQPDVPIEEAEPVLDIELISVFSAAEKDPNYDYLVSAAQSSDSGATLLLAILAHTGYTEPIVNISEYKSAQMLNLSKQAALEAQETSAGLSQTEIVDQRFLKSEAANLNERLAVWNNIDDRVKQAKLYYNAVLLGAGGVSDMDALGELYDDTEQYDSSSLLAIIKQLRALIPSPRSSARGRTQPNAALNNTVEAERLVRLLMLEESGQLSFE